MKCYWLFPNVNLEQAIEYATEQPNRLFPYLLSESNEQLLYYSLATNLQHPASSRVIKRFLTLTFR